MTKKTFIYKGPGSAFEFKSGTRSEFEGFVKTGQMVSLPDDHPHVKSMLASGHLIETGQKPVTKKEETNG